MDQLVAAKETGDEVSSQTELHKQYSVVTEERWSVIPE